MAIEPDRFTIRLPYVRGDRPPLVEHNGEDITQRVRDISVSAGVDDLTQVTVTYLACDVNMEDE